MRANPITIEALEMLDAIDRRGSFAKASEELNKATSALSYGVQKLEEQLDIALFQRQGRRSVLTPAGKLVLEEGRKILYATDRLADKAKEVATGWEPRLRIGLEFSHDAPKFFQQLEAFLNEHESLEVDICEVALNGGWEKLENNEIDLVVGAPGPVPVQKGYRALSLGTVDMVAVVASHHPLAKVANKPDVVKASMPKIRKIVTHDTAAKEVVRSEGLFSGNQILYVQTIDQKIQAQLAGVGVGHLPRCRIQHHLDSGQLVELKLDTPPPEVFVAWKIASKGKALLEFSKRLAAAKW